jgi:hypothetical protein
MTPPRSVTTWLALLKAGDPDAADALGRRYFAQLVELARQHLPRHARRAADGEDVALAAFAGFCAGIAAGRVLTDPERGGGVGVPRTVRRKWRVIRGRWNQEAGT